MPSTSSARRDRRKRTRMDRRLRTDPSAIKGLLGRQLASIADTLAQASQRRGPELQDSKTRKLTVSSAEQASRPSITSGSRISRGSDSGDNRAESEQLHKDLEDVDISMPRATMDTTETTGIGYSQAALRGDYVSECEDDPKKMLAELLSSKLANDEADETDDPKRMLAELESRASSLGQTSIDDGPKKMLADLDRKTQSLRRHLAEDDDDLEALRSRLTTMLSPSCDRTSHDLVRNDIQLSWPLGAGDLNALEAQKEVHDDNAIDLDKKSIPYAVALELESTGCKWDVVKGWTTYMFSSGLDGHVAQQQKSAIVKRATEELESIIQHTLKEELRYRELENKERLPGRLIISNLAADADEDELRRFFYKYSFDIRDIIFLEERDPIKRTRVAHIDMWTRKAAIQASYTPGHIFGLCLNIRLAVEQAT